MQDWLKQEVARLQMFATCLHLAIGIAYVCKRVLNRFVFTLLHQHARSLADGIPGLASQRVSCALTGGQVHAAAEDAVRQGLGVEGGQEELDRGRGQADCVTCLSLFASARQPSALNVTHRLV